MSLIYPQRPTLREFLIADEPPLTEWDFAGDTQPISTPLDIAIVDIGDDDEFDIRDCDLGGI